MTTAQRLRDIRKKNGLNQKQVAQLIGVSPGAVCHWEKGDREISNWVIKAYSAAFKVPETYFTDTDNYVFAERIQVMDLTSQEQRLLQYFRLLDEKTKERYLQEISKNENGVSDSDTD